MDIRALKQQSPALYADLLLQGINAERQRVTAILNAAREYGAVEEAIIAVEGGLVLDNQTHDLLIAIGDANDVFQSALEREEANGYTNSQALGRPRVEEANRRYQKAVKRLEETIASRRSLT
ncbi:hypothetical protein [Microbulbifer taiwanensis]|uniref:Uncharacterized protein n=1 Tax=Microbulbifer taiwanensis TaxID=986746 RepID=A0ABW1YIB2_9GAMM|nr:hypothetical protein [Microbulbifer taiwanensis]